MDGERRGEEEGLSRRAFAGLLATVPMALREPLPAGPAPDGWEDVRAHGARGNGAGDDTAAIESAIRAARGRAVFFPPGEYPVRRTLVLDQGPAKLLGSGGQGSTTIVKHHAGDAVVVAFDQVEFHRLAIDSARPPAFIGGRGIRVVRGNNFRFVDSSINNIDTGIEFAADAGSGAMIANCRIAPYTATPGGEGVSIRLAGPDTASRDRHVVNLSTGAGIVDVRGCQNFFLANCIVRNILADAATFGLHVVNCRYGSMGQPITFDGRGSSYIGCMLAGDLTLAPTLMASTVVGNMATQASYRFLDRSGVGNNLVLHGEHTAAKFLNKHLVPNVPGRTLVLAGVSADRGDASVVLRADQDAPTQRFATPLSADRTVSLATAGAYPGARFRVVRTGLGAHRLDVGGLRDLPPNRAGFVEVEFDGASWVLVGAGTL